jgi:hypothetical protein
LRHYGLSEEFPEFGVLGFFAFNLVFYGFGEETGWRGFVLPRLQQRHGKLTAATLLTFFWAIWHIPLFFYRPGYTSMGLAGVAGWIISLWTGSLLLSWLYNGTRGNILVVSIFHATIDIAFFSVADDSFTTNGLGFLITLWGVVIAVKYTFFARREGQDLKFHQTLHPKRTGPANRGVRRNNPVNIGKKSHVKIVAFKRQMVHQPG